MASKLLAQTLQLPWMDDGQISVEGELPSNPKLGDILTNGMDYIFIFAGIGLFLMLLRGGFTFLTSTGDTKKLEQGKGQLTNALLGFIIIFAAYWLVQIFGTIFGLDSIQDIFGAYLLPEASLA